MTKKSQPPVDEYPEDIEEPTFKKADIPAPTITDVIIKIQVLSDEVRMAIEAIKALGQDVIKNNEETIAKLDMQNIDFHEIKDAIVYGLANIGRTTSIVTPQPKQQVEKVQQVGVSEYDSLPWKPTKYGHYIFSNTVGAEKLVKAIAESNNKLRIGGYTYKQSGEGGKFVNRSQTK